MARNVRISIEADASAVGRETRKAEGHLTRLGKSGDRANKRFASGGSGLLKYAAGLASIGAAAGLAGSAVETTEDLAKGTAALTRITGLDTKTASAWVETMRVRGVESNKLTMGFTTFSKNIKAANDGGEKQIEMFKKLGVSQEALRSGDTEAVLNGIADAFKNMKDGPEQTAIASKLFGRSMKDLLPLLNQGSAGLRDMEKVAEKYGTTLDKNGIKKALEMVKAQREMKFATDGLKLAIGQALIPALTKAVTGVSAFVAQMRSGEGAGGRFAARIREVVRFVKEHETGLKRAAVAITGLVVAYRGISAAVRVVSTLKTAFSGLQTAAGATRGVGTKIAENIIGPIRGVPGRIRAALTSARGIMSRVLGGAGTVGGSAAANNAATAASTTITPALGRSGIKGKMVTFFRGAGAAAGIAAGVALASEINKAITSALSDRGDPGPALPSPSGNFWDDLFKRKGGTIGFQAGGLIPAMLSPGELGVTPAGGSFVVPGTATAADSVFMPLPSGTEIFTGSGQQMLASGASRDEALRRQAPHFQGGGEVPRYRAGGRFPTPKRVGASQFSAPGEAGGYRGTLNKHPWAYAELSKNYHDWSALGNLPLGYKLAVGYKSKTVALGKHDVGQGGGDVGGLHRSIDLLSRGANYLNLPGLGVVTIQDTSAPEGAKGRAALGTGQRTPTVTGGRRAASGSPRTINPPLRNAYAASVLDSMGQGYEAGAGGGSPFFDYRGLGSDFFGSVLSSTGFGAALNAPRATTPRVTRPSTTAGSKGGYVSPFQKGASVSERRVDRGQDAGSNLMTVAMGDGVIATNSGGFPGSTVLRLDKPYKGHQHVYYGHSRTRVSSGQRVKAGQIVAKPSGVGGGPSDHTEIGFSSSGGAIPGWTGMGHWHPQGATMHDWIHSMDKRIGKKQMRYRKGGIVGQRDQIITDRRQLRDEGARRHFDWAIKTGHTSFRHGGRVHPRRPPVRRPPPRRPANPAHAQFNAGRRAMTMVSQIQASPTTAKAKGLLRSLAYAIQSPNVNYGTLTGLAKRARQEIAKLSRKGLVGQEITIVNNLRDVLSMLEAEVGRRIGSAVGESDRTQAGLERSAGRFDNELILAGIDPESAEGQRRKAQMTTGAIGQLTGRRAGLGIALDRARRTRNPDLISKVQGEIDEVDDQILGLQASLVANTQAVTDNTDALVESQNRTNELIAEQVANQKRIIALATTQGPGLMAALAAVLSGDIGGRIGLGFQTPGYAGAGARY